MIARATVRPPTPESKMPIGAVLIDAVLTDPGTRDALTPSTLPPGSGGDRAAAARVGPANQEGGQQATERAEQMSLPGHGHHPGDVGGRHPHDAGPEQAAVE